MKIYLKLTFLLLFVAFYVSPANAMLGNNVNENKRQFGKELDTKDFTGKNGDFCGKKSYPFSLYGWQVEAIYADGKSFSETVRPKGGKVTKEMISEKEANSIADMLYPKKERGRYRKQIDNANFVSHFFEYGVISFEMQMDKRRKRHIGVIGVRTVLYSNGDKFKDIMVNAYH